MKGYDLNLIEKIYEISNIPITVLGGAGSFDHFSDVIDKNWNNWSFSWRFLLFLKESSRQF